MSSSVIRRLILVVHGVGQQTPGETVNLVAACLKTPPKTEVWTAALTMVEEPPKEQQERLDQLSRTNGGRTNTIPDVFPCHIFHRTTQSSDEVYAEVYWADVAKTSHKLLGILLQLFQVILGLAHLVRESAQQCYRSDWLSRNLALAGVWIMHGPIAAINSIILILAFAGMALEVGGYTHIVDEPGRRFRWVILLGAVLGFFSVYLYSKTGRYLMRHLFLWMLITSCLSVALAIVWHKQDVSGEAPVFFTYSEVVEVTEVGYDGITGVTYSEREFDYTSEDLAVWIEDWVCDWAGSVKVDCWQGISGVYSIAGGLIALQWAIWLVLLWGAVLLLLCHVIKLVQSHLRYGVLPPPSIAPAALSGMMMTWLFALSCIWAVSIFLYPDFGGHRALFVSAFHTVYVNWIVLGVAGSLAAWLVLVRLPSFTHARVSFTYFDREGRVRRHPPRMILARSISATMMAGSALLFVAMVLFTLVSVEGSIFDTERLNKIDQWTRYYLDELFMSVVILGGILYVMRDELAVGLGIANDIINYMRSDDAKGRSRQSYTLRNRIDQRFVKVARELLERHRPDELIIVAHSQGTVISLDALRTNCDELIGKQQPLEHLLRRVPKKTLITLGSPFSHLYQEYFPDCFQTPTQGDLSGGKWRWINIFRKDDFIGTHILPPGGWDAYHGARTCEQIRGKHIHHYGDEGFLEQHEVGLGGHTFYWVEPEVQKILQEAIAPEDVEAIPAYPEMPGDVVPPSAAAAPAAE
ncbi:MAG: hypothetical protein AAGC81_00480 [Pseudomonadota bacterium]